jgi:DNA-binding transcriptional MerR regulator
VLKIGEIAKQTGVSVATLRYYETCGLLLPAERSASGYRYYSVEIIQRVKLIKKAQSLNFSLSEIEQILNLADAGTSPCLKVKDLLDRKIDEIDRQIHQLQDFRADLKGYRDRWASEELSQSHDPKICRLLDNVQL